MARKERINEPGYYVISRGVQKRNIFLDNQDFETFFDFLIIIKDKFKIDVNSYCLMSNHYHLLIKTNKNNISQAFQYINTNYSKYFNHKYKKVGTLWQGRFLSFYIYDENDLFTISKYIERNPIKANMVKKINQYKYQSFYGWKYNTKYKNITNNSTIYDMTIQEYEKYINNDFTDDIYDIVYSSPKIITKDNKIKILYKRIETFFEKDIQINRNINIRNAYKYGYNITDIAKFLNLCTKTIRTSLELP